MIFNGSNHKEHDRIDPTSSFIIHPNNNNNNNYQREPPENEYKYNGNGNNNNNKNSYNTLPSHRQHPPFHSRATLPDGNFGQVWKSAQENDQNGRSGGHHYGPKDRQKSQSPNPRSPRSNSIDDRMMNKPPISHSLMSPLERKKAEKKLGKKVTKR